MQATQTQNTNTCRGRGYHFFHGSPVPLKNFLCRFLLFHSLHIHLKFMSNILHFVFFSGMSGKYVNMSINALWIEKVRVSAAHRLVVGRRLCFYYLNARHLFVLPFSTWYRLFALLPRILFINIGCRRKHLRCFFLARKHTYTHTLAHRHSAVVIFKNICSYCIAFCCVLWQNMAPSPHDITHNFLFMRSILEMRTFAKVICIRRDEIAYVQRHLNYI